MTPTTTEAPQVTIGAASATAIVPGHPRPFAKAPRHLAMRVNSDGSGRVAIYHTERARLLADLSTDRDGFAAIATAIRAHVADPVVDALVAALDRWDTFARQNLMTDADYHDADGTGWITATRDALDAARATKGA